jgi:hypothetical protein
VRRAEELLMDAAPTARAAALEAMGDLMNYRGQYSGCIQVRAGKLPEVLRCRIVDEKQVVRRAALNCCTAVLTQEVWNATPREAVKTYGQALLELVAARTRDRACQIRALAVKSLNRTIAKHHGAAGSS